MTTIFETESGSTYELESGRVRRVNEGYGKRRDGDWLTLRDMFPNPPVVGSSVVMIIESLAAAGPDDVGTPFPDPNWTTRTTSTVTHVDAG